eukprot:Polyplicarium_translucidae@DN3308_c2_g2_i3.p3
MKEIEARVLKMTLERKLPEEIAFVSTQELEDEFPELTPKERETRICKRHGAVFLMQIGKKLRSGVKHDDRAPDYDDWELNGDILVYCGQHAKGLELSSMGIRVDKKALLHQLRHGDLANRLPLTIGGGIGQSRMAIFLLEKMHICEVQASLWGDAVEAECAEHGIPILYIRNGLAWNVQKMHVFCAL